MSAFGERLVRWQRHAGRHDLPWQRTRDPYAVWVSEIMLQQTQVATVLRYYARFIERFPDPTSLAAAASDDVLGLWSGLGYYSRARNLKKAAEAVVARHGGRMPESAEALAALPGIGRSTAAAIRVFAFGQRDAILDGNVKRVLARHAAVSGWPGETAVERRLWALAWERLPDASVEVYTQGLMDLGATLCTRSRPRCGECPVAADCEALARDAVGSLPSPRPARPLPERRTFAIVAVDADGRVLLERRPPSGIWGGLWSLPEIESEDLVVRECARRFGLSVEREGSWAPVHHTFTHFRLEIVPVRVRVAGPSGIATEPGALWVDIGALATAPLPAPVRAMLSSLSVTRSESRARKEHPEADAAGARPSVNGRAARSGRRGAR